MMHFLDRKLFKFLLVGVGNTLLSAAIMFGLYNLLHRGYWESSAVSYVIGSVVSFFLNKHFTFENKDAVWKTALRFTINVAVCYILAYSVAKPTIMWAFHWANLPIGWLEQGAMLFGMCLFTVLNYFGQRFFAFREKRAQ